MSYTINFTGSAKSPFVVNNTTVNITKLPISIIGKSTPNWGEVIQENIIKVLENFDNDIVPFTPSNTSEANDLINGMLWSDKSNIVSRQLKFHDAGNWKNVLVLNTGTLPLTGQYFGQIWGLGVSLYFWNGSSWKKIDTDSLPLSGGTVTNAISCNTAPTLGNHLTNKTYVDAQIGSRALLLSTGGTVAGSISVGVSPTLGNHLTNKTYVDSSVSTSYSTVVNNFVQKTGGTLTGFLTLHSNPTNNFHPVTKQYLDAALASIGAGLGYTPVNKAGDTLTGFLFLNADPTNALHPATKQYVDNNNLFLKLASGGTVAGAVSFTNSITFSNTVIFSGVTSFTTLPTSAATPVNANQFITKGFADTTYVSGGGTVNGNVSLNNAVVINNDYNLITRIYADSRYLLLSGGNVGGNITLTSGAHIVDPVAPTASNHLTNKAYVDGAFLLKAGGVVTGQIELASPPTIDQHVANKLYVDTKVATSGTSFIGGTILQHIFVNATFVDPIASNQLVTYGYMLNNFVHRDPVTKLTTFREVASYESVYHGTLTWGALSNTNLVTKGLVDGVMNDLVMVSGDTMTGLLSYDNSLVVNNDYNLINRLYADGRYLTVSGGTYANNFTFSGTVTSSGTLTVTGNASFSNALPTSTIIPTTSTQLVNKAYVDNINTIFVKDSYSNLYQTDFMNGINGTIFTTNHSNGGTSNKYAALISGACGVLDLSTSTAANGGAEINDGFASLQANDNLYMLMRLYIPTLSTGTEEYKFGFGYALGGSLKDGTSTNSFSVKYDRTVSTNWIVEKDGVNTITSSPVVSGQLHIVKILYNNAANTISILLNGTQIHQYTSTAISSNYYGFQTYILKSAGTTARSLLIDKVLYGKVVQPDSNWIL